MNRFRCRNTIGRLGPQRVLQRQLAHRPAQAVIEFQPLIGTSSDSASRRRGSQRSWNACSATSTAACAEAAGGCRATAGRARAPPAAIRTLAQLPPRTPLLGRPVALDRGDHVRVHGAGLSPRARRRIWLAVSHASNTARTIVACRYDGLRTPTSCCCSRPCSSHYAHTLERPPRGRFADGPNLASILRTGPCGRRPPTSCSSPPRLPEVVASCTGFPRTAARTTVVLQGTKSPFSLAPLHSRSLAAVYNLRVNVDRHSRAILFYGVESAMSDADKTDGGDRRHDPRPPMCLGF